MSDDDPKALRLDQIPMPDPEQVRLREMKFKRGAHHAADKLSVAIDEVATIEQARALAAAFADRIGASRASEDFLDLDVEMREAKRSVFGN